MSFKSNLHLHIYVCIENLIKKHRKSFKGSFFLATFLVAALFLTAQASFMWADLQISEFYYYSSWACAYFNTLHKSFAIGSGNHLA